MANYIIIPARSESKRLPNKPWRMIDGKPLVIHTWERCKLVRNVDEVYIAIDDKEKQDVCESYGAKAIMTHPQASCGTHRCVEAAQYLIEPNLITNVQCEYPEINPENIEECIHAHEEEQGSVITLKYWTEDIDKYFSPAHVKLTEDFRYCTYFSRAAIPYQDNFQGCWIHVGVYVFNFKEMHSLYHAMSKQSYPSLCQVENLEQLAWLYEGCGIKALKCEPVEAMDTHTQLASFIKRCRRQL